jgi:hypothetical protein
MTRLTGPHWEHRHLACAGGKTGRMPVLPVLSPHEDLRTKDSETDRR